MVGFAKNDCINIINCTKQNFFSQVINSPYLAPNQTKLFSENIERLDGNTVEIKEEIPTTSKSEKEY